MTTISRNGRDNFLDEWQSSDTICRPIRDDTLTGGGSQDTFMVQLGMGTDIITDFGGIDTGVTYSGSNCRVGTHPSLKVTD